MTWHRSRPHRAFWLNSPCGARKLIRFRCGDRTCGDCRARDCFRFRRQYGPALKTIRHPKLITLTLKNVRDLTRAHVAFLRQAMKALLQRFQRHIRGGLYAIEVTNIGNGWHVHVHILADASYIPQDKLVEAWLAITGDSFIVDIRVARSTDEALSYLLKYVGKPPKVENYPVEDFVRVFNEVMKGIRLIHTFGSLYAYQPPRSSRPCEDCGEAKWTLSSLLAEWPDELLREISVGLRPIETRSP
jgi:hypothetical protein